MGVAHYVSALLRAATALAPQHEYLLYVGRRPLTQAFFTAAPFRQRVVDNAMLASPWIWQQFYFPWRAWRDGVYVILSPYYNGPLFSFVQQVVCICDVSFSLFPQDFPSWIHFKPRPLARPVSRRAARVITISEFSRKEIIRVYGLAPEKVVVIPPGTEDQPWRRPSAAQLTVCLGSPFFLFVGSLFPRRQVGLVLQALARLPGHYHFVLVGESDPAKRAAFMSTPQQWQVADRVHCLGHVSDEELDDLYHRAVALVSPSTYEGFGLPVLEAMDRRLPVIAWDTPVMREVAGSAAVLLQSGDVAGLATAMLKLGDDPALRQAFSHAGKERAGKFSWKCSASTFLAVLHAAARK